MSRFFNELKRRNVFRVGIAYLVAAWLLLQLTDILAPTLALPDWTARLVLLLLVIGFVPALIFAWAFELTPEGVKRERDIDRSQSTTLVTGRKLDFAIIAMMAAAIVYLVIDNYVLEPAPVVTADIERSIAVLPFRNRSNVVEDAYFVDGMHDDLLTQLSRLSSIEKVISRTSTEQYRNTTKTIPQIGQELGVATILEGGVQRSGNQIRINAQLIDTETDEHLWAHTYDRILTAENLFAIQSEITREIVAALHGVLSEQDKDALVAMPTNSLEAYAEFVLGRQALTKRTGEAILRAKAHFEKAVELDSSYALAYLGLADAYSLQREYLGVKSADSFAPRQAAIDVALSIDPLSGEAYTSLAVLRNNQGQTEEAEKYFLKAIELNPNYATAYHWYSILLRYAGRIEEAHTQILKALELDPLAPVLTGNLLIIQRLLGRVQGANTTLREGLERHPDYPGFYHQKALLLQDEGRLGEALRWMQSAVMLNPSNLRYVLRKCNLYLQIGDDSSAEHCYEGLDKSLPESGTSTFFWLHFYRSQFNEARNILEQRSQAQPSVLTLRYRAYLYTVIGDSSTARSILEEIDPHLFGDADVVIKLGELNQTVLAAHALYVDDEKDRANYLFDQALDAMQSMRRSGPLGYKIGDAFIHVARGERQRAILALRDAVHGGWRWDWFLLRSPQFASMQDEPEWIDLVNELEFDIAKQRQWYEEHQDEPVF